ncbi:NAD+ synthase [Methanonatronarchaeum sp. AMET-Sl]|uniref:NAD+ synthase n=1 Tax=Methanonatronarchaeum sp. AMET-Sl TaxID=3037654 RepID=UPI00244E4A2C|nr:NAD+ synthase [Methanonatronarchaeum sp. AMET-Sl]WGI17322.1 NAD+ synthase [Methanonatronarchaeum sp. AMET-Sl]
MVIPEISPKDVTRKITEFIEKEVERSGSKGVVIGLSGGLDSTVLAYLCSEIENIDVLGISLPISNSNKEVKQIKKNLDIFFREIKIESIINSFSTSIPEIDRPSNTKLADGNLIARTRMSILYYYSNINNMLVMGTGNKSEIYIGYFTKHGDGAADIQPIGDLYKTQVRELAKHLGVPKKIINKEPTAGLWKGQTDKNEIGMDYQTLDSIIHKLEEKESSINQTSNSLDINSELVIKVKNMHEKTVHKRKMPPICRINK